MDTFSKASEFSGTATGRYIIPAVLQIAREHGVTLTDAEVTPEVVEHWCSVSREEKIVEAKALAKRRRELVWRTVADKIPTRYRSALPVHAVKDKDAARATIKARLTDVDAYKKTIETAERIAKGQLSTVTFAGPTGAGKSTLAAILLRAVASYWHAHHEAGYVDPSTRTRTLDGDPTFARLMSENRKDEAFSTCILWTTAREIVEAQKRNESMDHFKSVPILVIDDLGGEPTQVNIGGVDEVIWARHDKGRAVVTILTTGFVDPTQEGHAAYLAPLVKRYSEALVRRVAEQGVAETIRVEVAS